MKLCNNHNNSYTRKCKFPRFLSPGGCWHQNLLFVTISVLTIDLEQEFTRFLCKGPDSKYFQLRGPYGLCCMFCKSSHRQCINESMWLCFNKTLFMDTKMWTLNNFHVSQNNLLFIIFQPFKKCKNILAREAYKIMWVWPVGCSLLSWGRAVFLKLSSESTESFLKHR